MIGLLPEYRVLQEDGAALRMVFTGKYNIPFSSERFINLQIFLRESPWPTQDMVAALSYWQNPLES